MPLPGPTGDNASHLPLLEYEKTEFSFLHNRETRAENLEFLGAAASVAEQSRDAVRLWAAALAASIRYRAGGYFPWEANDRQRV